MSFPKSLLVELAKEKQLTKRETDVFVALFGDGKSRLDIAEILHVQESAISTCLSGVYEKFKISESGPVKESRLKDELTKREKIWQRQQSDNVVNDSLAQIQPGSSPSQQIQERCRQKIRDQYSRMRLLSGDEIGVDQLYVDVWLLNRPPRTFQVSLSKLLETFDLRTDTLGLGDRIERNSGFEIANKARKLAILGKPGSGKTTFLKHLAADWCKGDFQPDLIAIFIEFRRLGDGDWLLADVIQNDLELTKQQFEKMLSQGKFLILMDGLDELPTSDLRKRVGNQLGTLAKDYPRNRFILTCRTQTIESVPEDFTSVEVADFSKEQVEQFVKNWFRVSEDLSTGTKRWEQLKYAIHENPALNELTVTPVVLSLICLVLQDEGEIPSEIIWLYQKGIKLLLNKWNSTKKIDNWEIGNATYQKLSIEQKEDLLIKIAACKFENPKNFVLFEQEEIAAQITQFLRLSDVSDGVAVLRAIEAQHGLLIERADELWSFSHLTFQEHFTVRWLNSLSPEQLYAKITSEQWQEVIKQLVRSQKPADRILRLINQAIGQSIAQEKTLNVFLTWVLRKSESVQADYNRLAIRAFYFSLHRVIARSFNLPCILDRNFASRYPFDLDHYLTLDFALARAFDCDLDCALDFDLAYSFNYDIDGSRAQAIKHAQAIDPELVVKLQQLWAIPPIASRIDRNIFQEWWQTNRTQWIEQLRQILIEQRNIGHDWQLNDEQQQKFHGYYKVNAFFVELINIPGAVSDNAIRAEIERTLLLPWEELQRQHPRIYEQKGR